MRLLWVTVLSVAVGGVLGRLVVRLRRCSYELREEGDEKSMMVRVENVRITGEKCVVTGGELKVVKNTPRPARVTKEMKKRVLVSMVTRKILVTIAAKGNVLGVVIGEEFLCTYRGYDFKTLEKILRKVFALYTAAIDLMEKEYQLYAIIIKTWKISRNLDFNMMVLDFVLDLFEYLHIPMLILREPLLKWSIAIARSVLKNVNYFEINYMFDNKNIKMGAWYSERSTITFEILKRRIFINFIDNKIGCEYSYIYYNMSAEYQYIAIISNDRMNNVNYIVLVWKEWYDLTVSCSVWSENYKLTKMCDTSSLLPEWEICNCDIMGVVIIESLKGPAKFKNDIIKFGGLTPTFIDLMNVKNLENMYRYGRMGDLLIVASIVICFVNIVVIILLIMYYEKRWKSFSPTKRQILCLFTMIWLNILLVQPLLITYLFRDRGNKQSTEYVAWGIVALYAMSSYTIMIGGSQIVLFVATINSKLWTCRFCDLIVGFTAIMSCALPIFIFYFSYQGIISSINRQLLLPEGFAVKSCILIPLLFVIALCFMLSGMGCYLPKRGGGISMMMVIYPLLILHSISYIMVLLMKESGIGNNYLQYLIYTSGIFLQAIYLLLWLVVLILLPIKNLTIFGKRDCNFRLEYIYLIDLHCPKVEENICPEK